MTRKLLVFIFDLFAPVRPVLSFQPNPLKTDFTPIRPRVTRPLAQSYHKKIYGDSFSITLSAISSGLWIFLVPRSHLEIVATSTLSFFASSTWVNFSRVLNAFNSSGSTNNGPVMSTVKATAAAIAKVQTVRDFRQARTQWGGPAARCGIG